MQYRIKLRSEEEESFVREFNVDQDTTFEQFKKAILASCNYEDRPMVFYRCTDRWERREAVADTDVRFSSLTDVLPMRRTTVDELIDGEGERLELLFDLEHQRSFVMKVTEEGFGGCSEEPTLLRSEGNVPPQDMVEETNVQQAASTIADDDEYDPYGIHGASFSDDELDLEGFQVADSIEGLDAM